MSSMKAACADGMQIAAPTSVASIVEKNLFFLFILSSLFFSCGV
jgi:hypothetical protein